MSSADSDPNEHPMIEGLTGRSSARSNRREGSKVQYRAGDEDRIRVIDPRRVVEKIRKERGDPDAHRNELPALTLPGHGVKYDDCGDDRLHFCNGCGEHHEAGRTCYRVECPRCAPAWCMRAATRAGSKLESLRRYLYSQRGESPRFHHIWFSPPDGFAVDRDDPLNAGYEVVKEMVDLLDSASQGFGYEGIDGGLIAYHPWRGEENDDRGFWKNVLFEGNEWEETVDQLEYAPHFHLILVADFVPGEDVTKSIFDKTGWTYGRITKEGGESSVSIYDNYDLARALTYSLSHAGVHSSDSYRYFGRVANFSAFDDATEEIDAAVRSVAPNTLGLPFRSTSCMRELDEDEEPATDASAPSNPDPEMADSGDQEDQDEDGEPRHCGGRLLPIRRAPEYLVDEDWREQAKHSDKLADAYYEWRVGDEGERGKDPPE